MLQSFGDCFAALEPANRVFSLRFRGTAQHFRTLLILQVPKSDRPIRPSCEHTLLFH
jgi:hypothetical protein